MIELIGRARVVIGTLVVSALLVGCTLPFGVTITPYDQTDPAQIVKDASAALKGAKNMTVKVTGTGTDGTPAAFTITGDGNGNFVGTGMTMGTNFDFVATGGKTYLKGHDFFARLVNDPTVLAKIDDNYVIQSSDLSSSAGPYTNPAAVADCLDSAGTLTRSGTDSASGHNVVVLVSKGDGSFTSSFKVYIATDSPHYMYKITTDNADKDLGANGKGKCTYTSSSSGFKASATLELTDFGKSQTIQAPPNPVDLGQ